MVIELVACVLMEVVEKVAAVILLLRVVESMVVRAVLDGLEGLAGSLDTMALRRIGEQRQFYSQNYRSNVTARRKIIAQQARLCFPS